LLRNRGIRHGGCFGTEGLDMGLLRYRGIINGDCLGTEGLDMG